MISPISGRLEGYIDAIQDGWVLGWVWLKDRPLETIEIRVLLDGREVGRAVAEPVPR